MRRWQKILLSLFMVLGCGIAQSTTAPAVPAPLEPWRAWVLDQHRDLACPPHYASLGEHICRWPGRLLIEANDSGASFAQDWKMYGEGWVDLPGDQRYWPQDVRVNDRAVAVIERDGRPVIRLAAGEYHVQGNIHWDGLPPRLALPEDSGLLGLTLNGKPVNLPSVDERGGLLFGENRAPETVADSLSVQVFRQLQDNIPLQLETVVRFRVAGRDRELVLGQLLLDGWIPLALDTPLPARIEPDGRLRVQLRAGEWEVHLRARAEGQPTVLASKRMDASTHQASNHENSWPEDEIWSLQDNRNLRQITAAGPASIDPSQTDMPPEWRQLPAWLLHAGDQLTITEHQRGDALVVGATTGEALAMTRDLWLDFDGKGITSRDVVNGVLKQATRFSTAAGQQLGRAEVNGEPQLITRLESQSGQPVAGIELRPGPLDLLAMSRLEQSSAVSKTLPVSGWQRDFNQVAATLHLPPGWMVLHAAGADSAQGSWLARWNLWAIFLVLIVAAASGRLLGATVGLLACCTLGLTYHTPNAPVFLWLAALVGVALLRVLPEGRVRRWLGLYNGAVFVLLTFVLLNFAVEQARRSLYPQLELGRYMTIQQPAQAGGRMAAAPASAAPVAQEMLMKRENTYDMASALSSAPERKLKTGYDANAKVQTGPGEPAWQWQRVALGWSGPVVQGQTLHLYLLSPDWHRLWNLVSVLLVFAFAAKLLRAAYPAFNIGKLSARALVPVALLLTLLLMPGAPVFAQQAQPQGSFPDAALLTELEQRLTRSPDCDPQCASFNRGVLQVDANNLRLDLQIDAQERVAVPLPVMRNQWQPRTVLVDGEASDSLRRDSTGQLWIVLEAGTHRVLLEGSVLVGSGNADSIQLPFEMPVHNLAVEANGWQVSGVTNGQVAGRSVQLTRDKQSAQDGLVPDEEAAPQLLPDQPKPFLLVTRTLVLGLDWQVQTSVLRLAPAVGAITVPVTVLPGEAVLTPGIDVVDGKVQVVMSANSRYFAWTSSFKQNSAITLTAVPSAPWVEHWLFDIAPIWHVDFSGLNPVKQDMQTGELPRWQPWPGESLTATVTRPEAVSGSTRTIESVSMDYRPGARSAEATLSLQVRSSQGGELPLTLPAASQLQRVTIDGVEQSNSAQGNPAQGALLRLPLRPGNQMLVVNWRQDETPGWRTVTPQPKIDEALSNIELKLSLPAGRWLLGVGGPAMGPALLFWGVLVVIVLVAIALGRSRIVPVATWQWLLLGIGMSTVNSVGSILVVLWFMAMAHRRTLDTVSLSRQSQHLVQLGLAFLTLLALGNLISTIPMSLLSTPDMQVVGNQSSASQLLWYQDRTLQGLPTAWALSLPMWVYRAVMLVWSLWLVFALMAWCRWGWECFSAGELWRTPVPAKNTQPDQPKSDQILPDEIQSEQSQPDVKQ